MDTIVSSHPFIKICVDVIYRTMNRTNKGKRITHTERDDWEITDVDLSIILFQISSLSIINIYGRL